MASCGAHRNCSRLTLAGSEKIDLISLDVDVLRQFSARLRGNRGPKTTEESLQSVGRPLSGGYESAKVCQSTGSKFLEVPRRGENGAVIAVEERPLPETCRVVGKQKGGPSFESKHYNHRTSDNTRVHTVSHDVRLLSVANDRTHASSTVPSIEITSAQDSEDKWHYHTSHAHTDTLLTTNTSIQDAVRSHIPPQLPKKERKGKSPFYNNQGNSEGYGHGLDEETTRLIRTCEERDYADL
ncbi:hypothetical protein Bbelb_159810 [Branchiostoma belcheri]|nr:hypothetical protein Bbelb_159810 [Branchiostoma belcheri]